MKVLTYNLPDWVAALPDLWVNRPALPPGSTYNVAPDGVVVGVPPRLIASVVGSCTLGLRGSDVDFGVVAAQGVKLQDREYCTTVYPQLGAVVQSEYAEVLVDGVIYAALALPEWRVAHDVYEYAGAARKIEALGGVHAWAAAKAIDKLGAYTLIGVSVEVAGAYMLRPRYAADALRAL